VEFSEALDKHLAAVSGRDLTGFLATVHPDVSMILPNGKFLAGRPEVEAFHREWFDDPDWSLSLDRLRQTGTDGTGVAVCDVTYHDLDGSGQPYDLRYLLTLTFTREDGTWLLLHDQNTLTP